MERDLGSGSQNDGARAKESRLQRRARLRREARLWESGTAEGLSYNLADSNYDAAGVAAEIAKNKMRALDYDVVKESIKIVKSTRTIYDYSAEKAAETIISDELSYSKADREVDEVARKSWTGIDRMPNY